MTYIYMVKDEGVDIEDEYRDFGYFSTLKKAQDYIEKLAEEASTDEDGQDIDEIKNDFAIYKIKLDVEQ